MIKSIRLTINSSETKTIYVREKFSKGKILFYSDNNKNVDVQIKKQDGTILIDSKINALNLKTITNIDIFFLEVKENEVLEISITNNEATTETITLNYYF